MTNAGSVPLIFVWVLAVQVVMCLLLNVAAVGALRSGLILAIFSLDTAQALVMGVYGC